MILSCDHLVRTMPHCLWQGAVLSAVAFAALRALPARQANARYLIVLAALFATLFAALVTYAWQDQSPRGAAQAAAANVQPPIFPPPAAGPIPSVGLPAAVASPAHQAPIDFWSPFIGTLWLAGVAVLLARTIASHLGAEHLLQRARPIDDPRLASLVAEVAAGLGIGRTIAVLTEAAVRVPATAGLLFPALLLPVELLAELPPGQLRIILAHELAHIRRYDTVVNFLQQIVEALLFFNPAVWWLSRQVRIEREACCDLLAVRTAAAPVEAARALAQFAERRLAASGAALAITGPEGSLLARVRRLIHPGLRVGLTVPWYTVMSLLILTGLLLLGLQATATLTARAAQELLSPEQRIAKIADIQNQSPLAGESHPGQRLSISGRLHTSDGTPVADAGVYLYTQNGMMGMHSNAVVHPDGTFDANLPCSVVSVTVMSKDFAPAFRGPLTPAADGTLPPIDIALEAGFTAHIQVSDSAGKPLPGVTVHVQDNMYRSRTLVADDAGVLTLAHAAVPFPVALSAIIPGYQAAAATIALAPDQTPVWKLSPAKPTTGLVLDEKTRAPLAGATIALISRASQATSAVIPIDPANPTVLAVTDAQGRFTLDTLIDGMDHQVTVSAPEHGSIRVPDVLSGQNRNFTLGLTRVVRGRLTGDLSQLKTRTRPDGRSEVVLYYMQSVELSRNSLFSYQVEVAAPIDNGTATFEIRNAFDTPALLLPGKRVPLPTQGEITIDLSDPQYVLGPTRRVNFILDTPAGAPAPRGTLSLMHYDAANSGSMHMADVPITDGKGFLEVSTPWRIQFSGQHSRIPGYWLQLPGMGVVDVAKDPAPLDIHVLALPAGLVRGRVLEADGKPFADQFNLTAIVIEKSQALGDRTAQPDSFYAPKGSAEYLVGTLPLGGTYRLAVTSASRIAISAPFTLTDAVPIQTLDVQFARGVGVTGRILDAAGTPIPSAEFMLTWQSPWSHSFSTSGQTDAAGNFALAAVNENLPGMYEVIVQPRADSTETKVTLVPGKPLEVRVARGLELQGTVIDAATNKPLAHATVRAGYNLMSTTDDAGQFHFRNLPPGRFELAVEDAAPEGGRVTLDAVGSVTTHYPNGYVSPRYQAGDPTPITLRVQTANKP